jgi:hypothetical protein
MILNKDRYPRLHDDHSVEYLSSNPTALRFKVCNDANYWYIEVFYTHRKKLHDGPIIHQFENYIPNNILKKIKSDNTTFLLVLAVEPVETIVENLYEFMSVNGIPEHKIILLNELIDIDKEIDKISSKFNLQKIKSFWISWDEKRLSIELRNNSSLFVTYKPLEKKQYEKSFINFNRRWRTHRPLFVSLLHCHGLINKGFVSLGETGEGLYIWKDVLLQILKIADDDIKNTLLANKAEIINIPKLYVDTDDLTVNLAYLDTNIATTKLYEDSYFSVVSETCFFDGVGRFLTEKTFKPIVYQHPFILIAPAKSLEFLRKIGYKTFHPFIDESYDNVENDIERMKLVLKETERLSMLSESELYNFIDQIKPITAHNLTVLKNKKFSDFLIEVG